jgi:hypothetical protein
MKTIKTTEIMIERFETRVVRVDRRHVYMELCELCRVRVVHFSISQAAALLGLSETAIFRLAESGQIHSFENVAGSLLICSASLTHIDDEINRRLVRVIENLETNREHQE